MAVICASSTAPTSDVDPSTASGGVRGDGDRLDTGWAGDGDRRRAHRSVAATTAGASTDRAAHRGTESSTGGNAGAGGIVWMLGAGRGGSRAGAGWAGNDITGPSWTTGAAARRLSRSVSAAWSTSTPAATSAAHTSKICSMLLSRRSSCTASTSSVAEDLADEVGACSGWPVLDEHADAVVVGGPDRRREVDGVLRLRRDRLGARLRCSPRRRRTGRSSRSAHRRPG